MTKIPVRRRRVPRQVRLGHRKVIYGDNNETLEKHLAVGRNLRKSDAYPIKCRVKLNRVWKDSKENIEATRRNRERMEREGTLPPSVPIEPSHYISHWTPFRAIIPDGGITKDGYVIEAWIDSYSESIEIDNQLKCHRLFRPQFRKFNPSFFVENREVSNTLTPNVGV